MFLLTTALCLASVHVRAKYFLVETEEGVSGIAEVGDNTAKDYESGSDYSDSDYDLEGGKSPPDDKDSKKSDGGSESSGDDSESSGGDNASPNGYSDNSDGDNPILNIIASLIPKTFDDAYGLASEILPLFKNERIKKMVYTLYEKRENLLGDMPEILEALVPTLKPIFEAVANDKEISDEDTLKYKKEIVKHAKPMLKNLADVTKEVLPGLEALTEGSVDDVMKQLSFLDGEIKQLVEDSLHWGNKLLNSFIKIVKTEDSSENKSDESAQEEYKEKPQDSSKNEDGAEKPKEYSNNEDGTEKLEENSKIKDGA